ncbi:insulinase family protein [Streptomyces buecherae]|uniref:insulinase family protein n=1 Tax=Streptomyces buecherae TaxID=2763006 RepID=UPI003404EEAE
MPTGDRSPRDALAHGWHGHSLPPQRPPATLIHTPQLDVGVSALAVGVGLRDETSQQAGFAHFLEHLACRLPDSLPLPGGIDAPTGRTAEDTTTVIASCLPQDLAETTARMAARLLPRYLLRGPARGPLASGPGMAVAPCRSR